MRRTAHRRRFHTDRVVAARRKRYLNEWRWYIDWSGMDLDRLSYGRLQKKDPWDCGNPQCGVCHMDKQRVYRKQDRRRAERAWRRDWGL